MNCTVIALAFVQTLGLTACEPDAGVVVTNVGGRVQVVFVNCSRPAQTLPVKDVEVRRISAGKDAEPECTFSATHYATIVGSWRYGEPVDGYEMHGCGPLQPGETYEVHAITGPSGATAVFKVKPDGDITTRSGGCR
jgi:hypothetical protein